MVPIEISTPTFDFLHATGLKPQVSANRLEIDENVSTVWLQYTTRQVTNRQDDRNRPTVALKRGSRATHQARLK